MPPKPPSVMATPSATYGPALVPAFISFPASFGLTSLSDFDPATRPAFNSAIGLSGAFATGCDSGDCSRIPAESVALCGAVASFGPTTSTATVTIATDAATAAHCNVAQRNPPRAGFTAGAPSGRDSTANPTISRQAAHAARWTSTLSRSCATKAFSAKAFNCSASGCGPSDCAAMRAVAILGICSMLPLFLSLPCLERFHSAFLHVSFAPERRAHVDGDIAHISLERFLRLAA